ncbi:MAG: PEGA domain-containing protein [Verrucomicrobiota bacterium]
MKIQQAMPHSTYQLLRSVLLVAGACLLGAGCDQGASSGSAIGTGRIMVTTTPEGARILCNGESQGVSPVEITGLLGGRHLIVVEKEGFIEARKTVEIKPGQREGAEFILETELGMALLHSEPQGAEVEVDGAARGVTPLLLTDLSLGQHRVTMEFSGFSPREIVIDTEDRRPQRYLVSLASDSGKVTFNSTPSGASVFIDGRNIGNTPVTQDRIAKGSHEVEFRMDGFADYKESLTIQSGTVDTMSAVLEPKPGSLRIVTIPDGARVYVNNEFRGEAPIELTDLAPGDYRVRTEVEGYEPDVKTVTVQNGRETIEEFRFIKNSGTLQLSTVPAGVQVFIDGQSHGDSKARGANTLSEPMRIDLLAQGEHRLQLVKKGFSYRSRKFFIQMDKITTLTEKMTRLFIPDFRIKTGDGPDEMSEGVLIQKHRNGDITIEVAPGIRRTIPKSKIVETEFIRIGEAIQP